VKGVEFQRGHGVKGVEFQRGHGGTHACILTVRNRRFRQRGAGGWGWLGRMASRALPFLLKGAKTVGKHALTAVADQTVNTGMRFLDDVLEGENVLASAKHRLKQSGDELRNTAKTKLKDGGLKLARTVQRKLQEHSGGVGEIEQQGAGRKRRQVITNREAGGRGRCCSITKKRKTIPYQNLFGGS